LPLDAPPPRLADRRHTPAEHDHVGVEEMDDMRKRVGIVPGGHVEDRLRRGVAGGESCGEETGRGHGAGRCGFLGKHAGGLDRAKLGAHVFGNKVALQRLEAILHPLVAEGQSAFLGAHRRKEAVILDVPLLFEKGGWRRCHLTVVVSAPYRVQRARVLARPGMTPDKFAAILRQQLPDRVKRARADVVIETGRGRRHTWLAVQRLVREHGIEPLWPRVWLKGRTGGSDDHGLLNIGRTWTEFPPDVQTVEQALECLRTGRTRAGGAP
jgi:dephospho-CoA kinase